jgi:hypothetical protein
MVAGYVRLKLIISPFPAAVIAARSELGPLSFVLVTVRVLPKTGLKTARMSSRKIGGENFVRIIADEYTASSFERKHVFRHVFRQRMPALLVPMKSGGDSHHCIRRPRGSSVFPSTPRPVCIE